MTKIKYNTQWVLDELKSGASVEYIFFWGHRGKPGQVTKACFSQWFPSSFVVGGDEFFTAEHWMMAHKAKLFDDKENYQEILKRPDPSAAKAFGRKVRNFDPNIWDASKFDIVVQGNVHKFSQNDDFSRFLIATEGKVLVEASPVDPVWGIGLSHDNPDAQNPAKWRGPNLLGFALMEARDVLMERET